MWLKGPQRSQWIRSKTAYAILSEMGKLILFCLAIGQTSQNLWFTNFIGIEEDKSLSLLGPRWPSLQCQTSLLTIFEETLGRGFGIKVEDESEDGVGSSTYRFPTLLPIPISMPLETSWIT